MKLIRHIEEAWGWAGVEPISILGQNKFGNFIVKDSAGKYWRLCPEELYCRVVARNREELDGLIAQEEFQQDWHMAGLAIQAEVRLGPLSEGERYCLKIPAALGGAYEAGNIGKVFIEDLIKLSGHIAEQIDGLPDGATVKFLITE